MEDEKPLVAQPIDRQGIELLMKQDIGAWNDWKKANLFGGESVFSNADLRGANLRGANLEGIWFHCTNFSDANFQDVDLEHTTFSKVDFSRAFLNKQKLEGISFAECNFSGANLNGANLSSADLRNSNFVQADLSGTNLSSADLNKVNLSQANLSKANVIKANLSGANLTGANLREVDLTNANLSNANFQKASLCKAHLSQANLFEADLSGAELEDAELWHAELRSTNFQRANLRSADLRGANLNIADFREADLSKAILLTTQALATDFSKAIFTGACLEDWHINSFTKLDEVICEHFYQKFAPYPMHSERRPPTGQFALGDFAKLVQDSLDTVDLIFNKGVDWKAFSYSFVNTQVENEGTPLAIRSIENKGEGVVLIRVAVPPDADKGKIHNDFLQGYEFAQKTLEHQFQARLEDKDKEINRLFILLNQSTQIQGEVQKLMADKSGIQQNFYGNIGNAAGNVEGDQKTVQHNYAPEQKQTLAEAAAEIQQLLKQLETQGYSPEAAQQQVASDLAKRVHSNPEAKSRLAQLIRYLGDAAANGLIGEAVVTVLKSAAQLAGIPIP